MPRADAGGARFVGSERLTFLWMVRRGLANPASGLESAILLLRGKLFLAWCRIRGVRFRTGRGFRLAGRIIVSGPGEVVLGDNVYINDPNDPARFWTLAPDARITIGSDTYMGATEFACLKEITVGERCILARAVILDTDGHSAQSDRRTNHHAPMRAIPVRIGNNVWIGRNVGILPGANIGDNSVVSFGAVCFREFPPNVIIVGNPAKVAAPDPMPAAAPADATAAPESGAARPMVEPLAR